MVEGSADFSDFPIVSGLHSQPPELDHGGNKSIKELLLVPGELVYDPLGRTISVQHLVGGEEPQPILEVGVVLVVEGISWCLLLNWPLQSAALIWTQLQLIARGGIS